MNDKEHYAYTVPFAKIPDKTIIADYGICGKCLSYWDEKNGCYNEKCPEIVYRNIRNETGVQPE